MNANSTPAAANSSYFTNIIAGLIEMGCQMKDVKFGNRRRNHWMTKVTTPEGHIFGLCVESDSDYASTTLLEAAQVEEGKRRENPFHPTIGMKLEFVSDEDICTLSYSSQLPRYIREAIWPK